MEEDLTIIERIHIGAFIIGIPLVVMEFVINIIKEING